MGTFLSDIRYGARTLWKAPGFTTVAVVALALGIGANSAIFSVVNAIILRPLPYPEPERLVAVSGRDTREGTDYWQHSYPNFVDLREQREVFEHVTAYSRASFFLIEGEDPERIVGAVSTHDLFGVLGVRPALGRAFTADEDRPGAPRVIVLGHRLWQRRFGGDPAAVGREIRLGSYTATVVGVMPPGFEFPLGSRAEAWMPLGPAIPAATLAARDSVYLDLVGRLREGVSVERARAEVQTIGARLAAQYPDSNANQSFGLTPMHENLVGNLRRALFVLLGAVAFVLLIACANVANLLLVRAAGRQKELAVRTALGAGRWRIMRQLLTESLLLAVLGGGLGLLLAMWGTDLLVSLAPADIPRTAEVGLDARVLLFTLGVTALTGVVFGLAPAWQASKADLNETLKEGGRGSTEGTKGRLRGALVVAEVAVSLVLLVCAGLLGQSFLKLLSVEPGFEARGVLTADVVTLGKSFPERSQQAAFFSEVLARVAAVPGVEAVGAVNPLPLGGNFNTYSFRIEGRPAPAPGEAPVSDFRTAAPGYFRAMGIPVLRGRAFDERDTEKSPPVMLVNEALARKYFPGEDPLGKRITTGDSGSGNPPLTREVVGVVGDVRHAGLEEETTPESYVSYLQRPVSVMTVVARAAGGDAEALAASVRGAIREVNREQPVYNVRTMEQLLAESVARRRFNMTLLAVFAGLALALAAVGLYGVMSYTVTQRTHEIGIRVALGAQAADVVRLVVGQGMALALAGVAVGLFGAFALTRLMASLLYGVSATDATVYAAVALLLSSVAFLASYLPARRAARVDPMVALRHE
ncbi:MAG TPA: ABC transporter permease [Pyrinomonadaceae bacterium]|nr:ABC transporter permease [Pyrinomonadaceae bacterium]